MTENEILQLRNLFNVIKKHNYFYAFYYFKVISVH
jgi:hypothetical protein